MRSVIKEQIQINYRSINDFVRKSGSLPYNGLRDFLKSDLRGLDWANVQTICTMLNICLHEKDSGLAIEGVDLRDQLKKRLQKEKSVRSFCLSIEIPEINYRNFNGFLNSKKGISTYIFEVVIEKAGLELRLNIN